MNRTKLPEFGSDSTPGRFFLRGRGCPLLKAGDSGGIWGGFVCPLLTAWNRERYLGTLRAAGFFCISLGAHRAAVNTLSEIGKPGSGCTADFTSDGQEPLNREHITCSW